MAAHADTQLNIQALPGVLPDGVRCMAVSEYCTVVEFGQTLSLEVNAQAVAFAAHLRSARHGWITDLVPALASVGVYYRPGKVPVGEGELPHMAVQRLIEQAFENFVPASSDKEETLVVPVCYGGEFGPDLADVARDLGLQPKDVMRMHAENTGVVLMLCFAPGHAQIGFWDERLGIGRRATPRTAVAAGSVAIANRQTVIYPFQVPGGWNVIGRTPLKMFDANRENPCLLRPGVRVRFQPITAEEFNQQAGGRT